MTKLLLEGGGAEVVRTGLLGSGSEVNEVIAIQPNLQKVLQARESKSFKD